jgi:hypothetical protein
VVKLLVGHSEGTGDADILEEAELEEVVIEEGLEEGLEDEAKVVASDVDVGIEICSLSPLWLVDETAVWVSLDVMGTEDDVEVAISSTDELVDVVSTNRFVEESEPTNSLLASVEKLCVVSAVEKIVGEVDSDEFSAVETFGGPVVVLEEVLGASLETLLAE